MEKVGSQIKPLWWCVVFKDNQESQLQTGKDQEQEKCRPWVGAVYTLLQRGGPGMERFKLHLDAALRRPRCGFHFASSGEPRKAFNEEDVMRLIHWEQHSGMPVGEEFEWEKMEHEAGQSVGPWSRRGEAAWAWTCQVAGGWVGVVPPWGLDGLPVLRMLPAPSSDPRPEQARCRYPWELSEPLGLRTRAFAFGHLLELSFPAAWIRALWQEHSELGAHLCHRPCSWSINETSRSRADRSCGNPLPGALVGTGRAQVTRCSPTWLDLTGWKAARGVASRTRPAQSAGPGVGAGGRGVAWAGDTVPQLQLHLQGIWTLPGLLRLPLLWPCHGGGEINHSSIWMFKQSRVSVTC